jgi:2'-5' RNA ligase
MPRLFVAVWPPGNVLDLLAALPRPAVDGVRWTSRDQWHVTLRFLGSVPELEPVVAALAGLATSPSVVARMGPSVGRFGHRILHVPVTGLEGVAGDVMRLTGSIGRPPEDRPFSGHVTLARVTSNARVDLRPLAAAPLAPAAWTVTDVCLVESQLSPAGARYSVVARFPLAFPNW